MNVALDEALVNFIAAAMTPPAWALRSIANDSSHPLNSALVEAMNSVPNEANPLDLVAGAIIRIIYSRRVKAFCQLDGEAPTRPYGHEALRGIVPDADCLVPASSFEKRRVALSRGGYAFHLPPTLPDANSSYWLTGRLLQLPPAAELKVRLDPFIVCSLDGYRSPFYKMITYGQPLDWDRLASLRSEEHGEWAPDALTTAAAGGVACTQLCWTPRDDGIHFQCEELPLDASSRPSRYAHAVYEPEKRAFTHADGAMRFYSSEELATRRPTHVRKAGKAGVRIKIFRTDGILARDDWCQVIAAFFVWNQDMQGYFLGQRTLAAPT